MRHYFDKFHGNLGQTGCVSFMFDRKGVIIIEADGQDEDALMMDALDAGAEDFAAEEGYYEITTDPDSCSTVREALEGKYTISSADVEMVPANNSGINSGGRREEHGQAARNAGG